MTAGVHIKDIVGRSEQGEIAALAKRAPGGRSVDHGETVARGFECRHTVLAGRPFDFSAQIKIVAVGFQPAK